MTVPEPKDVLPEPELLSKRKPRPGRMPYTASSKPDSVVIASGGLDSTTLVWQMISEGFAPHLLSFNYGQRHRKELVFAAMTARNLNLQFDVVDLTSLTQLISGSALVAPLHRDHDIDGNPDAYNYKDVPEGHYAAENMQLTIVPNRNMIMLSIAAGVAVNKGYKTVAIGVHSGDHDVYPDCRPEFIFAAGQAILAGNAGNHNFHTREEPIRLSIGEDEKVYYPARPIYAPFLDLSKADIAYKALELGVPLHLTWSCYKGGEKHCGRCGTCVERLEAIDEATKRFNPNRWKDFLDQTEYEDSEYWKTVVKK